MCLTAKSSHGWRVTFSLQFYCFQRLNSNAYFESLGHLLPAGQHLAQLWAISCPAQYSQFLEFCKFIGLRSWHGACSISGWSQQTIVNYLLIKE